MSRPRAARGKAPWILARPPAEAREDLAVSASEAADLLLALLLAAYPAGALAALAVRGALGRGLVAGCALVGALAGVALGTVCLATGAAPSLAAPVLPLTGLALRLDALSALFLVVVGLVGATAAVYGHGYSAAYEGRSSLRLLGAMLNVLLLSLSVQVMADNALTFLIAWEAMSLSAYAMVLTEHDRPGTVRAAHWYIALMHASFAALVAAFLLLSAGDLTASFAGMREAPWRRGCATRCSCWPSSASAPRRASCRCTSGCPWPIRSRRATSRR